MIRRIALVGDSLMQLVTTEQRWAELVAERLANIPGIGPLVSAGFQSFQVAEWTRTAGWNPTGSGSIDLAPYGMGRYGAGGSGNTATWTRPTQWRPVQSIDVFFGDYTGGGNWQYRIDGGTWLNMNQTLAQDDTIGKFHIPTPVASTIEFRQYNGTAAAGCMLYGVEPFFLDPLTTTQGLIVDNLAIAGTTLDELVTPPAGGDRMAWFDEVKVDPVNGGGAISNRPNTAVVMMHINDFSDINGFTTAQWAADIATFYARVSPLAPLAYMNYGEMNVDGYDTTNQAAFRAQTKTSAALHGIPVLDFFDAWAANGWGAVGTQNDALQAAGIVSFDPPFDNGHPTQAGHYDIAHRVYWFIRNQFLTTVGKHYHAFLVGSSGVGGSDRLGGMPIVPIAAATGTGTAFNAAVSLKPNATAATGTGTAPNSSKSIKPNASAATGTGSAFNARAPVAPNASAATGTGTASGPKVSGAPAPAAASGTGTAFNASVSIALATIVASGTGQALDAAVSSATNAVAASGTGTAGDASSASDTSAGAAAGTGSAFDPSVSTSSTSGAATGTGTAFDATAIVGASAQPATGSGTAFAPIITIAVSGAATGTGVAFNPSTSTSSSTDAASGTGTAFNPTVTSTVGATAQLATGIGAVFSPSVAIICTAGAASGTGQAFNPTVAAVVTLPNVAWSFGPPTSWWSFGPPTSSWRFGPPTSAWSFRIDCRATIDA